eukprot:764076-Hanusia_phi.AAC.3
MQTLRGQEPLERIRSDPLHLRQRSMEGWMHREGCCHIKLTPIARATDCLPKDAISVSCTECIKCRTDGSNIFANLVQDLKRLKVLTTLSASIDREGNLHKRGSHEVYVQSHNLLEQSIDSNGNFKYRGDPTFVLSFQKGCIS